MCVYVLFLRFSFFSRLLLVLIWTKESDGKPIPWNFSLFKSEGGKIVSTLSSSRYIKSKIERIDCRRNWTSKEVEWNEEAKISSERRVSLFEDACKSGYFWKERRKRIVKSLGFNDISAVSSIFVRSHEIRSNCVETYSNIFSFGHFDPLSSESQQDFRVIKFFQFAFFFFFFMNIEYRNGCVIERRQGRKREEATTLWKIYMQMRINFIFKYSIPWNRLCIYNYVPFTFIIIIIIIRCHPKTRSPFCQKSACSGSIFFFKCQLHSLSLEFHFHSHRDKSCEKKTLLLSIRISFKILIR